MLGRERGRRGTSFLTDKKKDGLDIEAIVYGWAERGCEKSCISAPTRPLCLVLMGCCLARFANFFAVHFTSITAVLDALESNVNFYRWHRRIM